jgi:uncharacterized membrane protein HdeD (DUF308 family)
MMVFRFGYENKTIGLIKSLLAIALGAFLIVTKANAMQMVVQIIAGAILVVNVVAFLLSLKYPETMMSSGSVMSALIALLLFAFSGPVSAVIRYVLGGFLFLAGGSQVLALLGMRNQQGSGALSFVMPVLMLLGGCLFFSEELIGNDIMGLMVGVACIIYGFSKLITVIRLNKGRSQQDDAPRADQGKTRIDGWAKPGKDSVKDVDYEKVD